MNKHPIIDAYGKPILESRFMSTQAQIKMKCPKCNSDPGYWCETPKGRSATECHGERSQAYMKSPDFSEGQHSVKFESFEQILQALGFIEK